jgi:hypothetical protein
VGDNVLGLFSKKNKDEQGDPQLKKTGNAKNETKISDKSIKPSAPKSMTGKKIVRSIFWVFMSLLFIKGAIAFAQGNRTINQTIVNGSDKPAIEDSVKGFAADFATEYFTWSSNFVADRSTRLTKFIKGVDSEMGLKNFDVKGSSKVTSAEVYATNQIDPMHIDVTVVVWRDVQPLPDQLQSAQGKATIPPTIQKKTYMVVPITLAAEGPVIQSYPRFVSEQQKGETVDNSSNGTSVGDGDILKKGKELADSFLKSWYEGNASQLRYFYADTVKSPDTLQKSDFTYDKLDKVSVYENPAKLGETTTYRIEASVIVKSDLGEPFTNSWNLQVISKDGRLYVLTNGFQQTRTITSPAIESPAPISSELPSVSITPVPTSSN